MLYMLWIVFNYNFYLISHNVYKLKKKTLRYIFVVFHFQEVITEPYYWGTAFCPPVTRLCLVNQDSKTFNNFSDGVCQFYIKYRSHFSIVYNFL